MLQKRITLMIINPKHNILLLYQIMDMLLPLKHQQNLKNVPYQLLQLLLKQKHQRLLQRLKQPIKQ